MDLVGTVHVSSFGFNNATRTLTVNFVNPLSAGSTGDIELKIRFAKGSTLDGATSVNTPWDKQINLGVMAPGESRLVKFRNLTAPATAGTYSLRVMVDAKDIQPEYSEGNNYGNAFYTLDDPSAATPASCMKPDFIVQFVELQPSPTITSTRFEVTVRVKNEGDIAGDAGTLNFWAASPSYVNLPATADESQALGVIAAGATVEVTFSDLIAPAVQGTYHARVVVDATGITDEYSEGNNQGGSTYTVFPLSINVASKIDGNHITWNRPRALHTQWNGQPVWAAVSVRLPPALARPRPRTPS